MSDRQSKIRERAHALWVAGGHRPGTAEADWAQAEREVGAQTPTSAAPRSKAGNGDVTVAKGAAESRGAGKKKASSQSGLGKSGLGKSGLGRSGLGTSAAMQNGRSARPSRSGKPA